MNSPPTLIEALGWTLLHFLWQGGAVATVLWVFLRVGKAFSPRVRYTAAAFALAGMVGWPAATYVRLARTVAVTPIPAAALVLTEVPQAQPSRTAVAVVPRALDVPGAVAASAPLSAAAETPSPRPRESLRGRLRAAFPGMVGAWAFGVLLLSARFLLGWRSVERLRRSGILSEDAAWVARFESLKARLKVSGPVALLVSATSAVPMVIGWFKPVVLVPAGLFLGLGAPQLEAILAHELAHIRRHDYLANLLQAVAETVLFYHPAVWWVSAQMRKEREHCCDDIASSITGNALDYVRALTALEEIRSVAVVPAAAVSAAGGSLLGRVRRLLGVAPREPGPAVPWVFAVVAVLVGVLIFIGMKEARGGPAPDTTAKKAADLRTKPPGDTSTYEPLQAGSVTHTAKAPEDMKVLSTAGYGTWPMPGGVTLEVRGETVHAADVVTTAVLAWPDGRRAVASVAVDAFGNREPWALAWEAGSSEFWIAKGSLGAQGPRGTKGRATEVVKVDFSSPTTGLAGGRVKSTYQSGWPKTGGPSPECRAAMEKLIEVAAEGEVSSESIAWPTSNPASMQANWLEVAVSILTDGACQISQHEGGPWPVEALEAPLRARAAAARAVWKKNMGEATPGEPHAVIFSPAATSDEVKQKVIDACRAVGLVPAAAAAAAAQPDRLGLTPVTDGTFMAQVLNVPDSEHVVILTKRAFTVAGDSTSRSGSITLPVNTSDKTLTIVYSMPDGTPGVLDLKTGGYPVCRFDLSRGRVFFVHFEQLEFSADVFQVPAGVNVPAISSPESVTRAADRVAAWYASADDRALWECIRVIVPEGERKPGQPLDAAAEKIVWGEPNDVGLRLGLGGLEPGAAVPVGQPLPLRQFIRNDGPTTLTLSPTQIFNEGVGGELIRTSDGVKFPHRKGYPWQSFFRRVRLAPGHYIALESGPMRTFMAEKDGSSAGGMGMMDHGFTVVPGEYTLRLTHGIGQFLGRPVNFHFGDPRGAPGLGEWTGVLRSASLPLQLADQQIKTAKPGSSEVFGRSKIDFEKGALKLRHYNGYPQMALAGEPWEPNSRDWKIKAADGDYLVAWAVGGHGIWLKDAGVITHLVVKDQLTETGHWTLDQAAGAIGPMPAGVRAAFTLPPPPVAQVFDFRKLPETAGPARIDGAFFEMALPVDGAVLKVPHGRKEFFVEWEGHTYGPAEGNPVVELGLTEMLRKKLAETPNTSGLATLETMIRQGRGAIRDCAFRLLGELKTPQTPFAYDALFGAMIGASIEDEEGSKELSPEAQTAYTYFWNLFRASRREWERTRPVLAPDRYQPGEKLAEAPGIVWTPGPDGVSLGVSGLPEGGSLEIGKSVPVTVYLRNDGPAAVKLSVPSEYNPVLQISVTDDKSVRHSAMYRFSTGVIGYQHRQLDPGTGMKVASVNLESYATANEAGSTNHKDGEVHNPRLTVPAGQYALHLEYRNFQEAPVAKGGPAEWTGKLAADPVAVKVKGPAETAAAPPAPTIRGVNLAGLPQREDVTTIAELYEPSPGKPGESRQKPGVFFMSLGEVGPWLYHVAGTEHFYLEVRPDPKVVKDVVYGPIDGHPAEKLNLAGWLKESPTHPDPGYARRVARDMLGTGDGPLASLALGWLGEFKAPAPPGEHDWLITAIEKHLTGNPRSSAANRAHTVLTRLRAMAATASAEWEKERKALPDESYGTGEPLDKLTGAVQWAGPTANGLRLGLAGLGKGETWAFGSEHSLEIYLRNDGDKPVKFSWTPRVDEGLTLLLTDDQGTTRPASIVIWDILLFHNHCRLDPGHFLKLKQQVEFKVLKTNADGTSPEAGTARNAFFLDSPGLYQFEASCHLGLSDWADSQGNKQLRPAGKWEGVLKTQPVEVAIKL